MDTCFQIILFWVLELQDVVVGNSSFTAVSDLFLNWSSYCNHRNLHVFFHTNNCTPMFAKPCVLDTCFVPSTVLSICFVHYLIFMWTQWGSHCNYSNVRGWNSTEAYWVTRQGLPSSEVIFPHSSKNIPNSPTNPTKKFPDSQVLDLGKALLSGRNLMTTGTRTFSTPFREA